jgi:HPt (histidine-containing phosphotransfer) domain-containing protein
MAASLEIDDLDLMSSLVGLYLDDLAEGVMAIAAGAVAADVEILREAAHKLKSGSRMLGAEMLGDLAEHIETLARNEAAPDANLLDHFMKENRRVRREMTRMLPFEQVG